jgi:hypothetical protein
LENNGKIQNTATTIGKRTDHVVTELLATENTCCGWYSGLHRLEEHCSAPSRETHAKHKIDLNITGVQ